MQHALKGTQLVSDSDDKFRAIPQPGGRGLESQILAATHDLQRDFRRTAQDIGKQVSQVNERLSRIEERIDAKADETQSIKRDIESIEKKLHEVETSQTDVKARFSIVVASLGAVALIALGALLKALHIG
jgi:septal ring factor EnvC (AmiA/AmiB activator)